MLASTLGKPRCVWLVTTPCFLDKLRNWPSWKLFALLQPAQLAACGKRFAHVVESGCVTLLSAAACFVSPAHTAADCRPVVRAGVGPGILWRWVLRVCIRGQGLPTLLC
jgi:hypothetical protein